MLFRSQHDELLPVGQADHIETTPDTVISLTNGQKFVVLEPADEVVKRVIGFRREIQTPAALEREG